METTNNTFKTKTDEKIEEILTYFETCPTIVPGSKMLKLREKALFIPDEVAEYLSELKQIVDNELAQSKEIIQKKDKIEAEGKQIVQRMVEAERKKMEAEPLVEKAKEAAKQIIHAAENRSKDLLTEATKIYNQMIVECHQYSENLLNQVESEVLMKVEEEVKIKKEILQRNRDGLRKSLQSRILNVEKVRN